MKFMNVSYEEFIKIAEKKQVIQFGASSAWHYYMQLFPNILENVVDKTLFVVDNNAAKQGTELEIMGRKLTVQSSEALLGRSDYVILITVSLAYQKSICEQLKEMGLPEDTECYSLRLMIYSDGNVDNSCVDEYFRLHQEKKIPARIHSFWFSGEEKPELYKRCVDSWHKYCPDFEIIEWNTNNYDITKNQYMLEAYEHKKWAFVSDYARLDLLEKHGGIYLDMDVELLTSLEPLLYAESFFCRQEDGFLELGSGFGVQASDPFIQKMLKTYEGRKLILPNGEMDTTPQPEWLNDIIEETGIIKSHNSSVYGEKLILSNDYITCSAGGDPTQTAKIGVHWHNAGWMDEKKKKLIKDSMQAKEYLIRNYFKK